MFLYKYDGLAKLACLPGIVLAGKKPLLWQTQLTEKDVQLFANFNEYTRDKRFSTGMT